MQIENTNGYRRLPGQKTLKLEVEFLLDVVPGAWAQPEDLMQWIAQHRYVQCVRLVPEPPIDVEVLVDEDTGQRVVSLIRNT